MKTTASIQATAFETLDSAALATATGGGDYASKVGKHFKDWKHRAGRAIKEARKGNVPGYLKQSAAATIDAQHAVLDVAGDAYKQFH
jgi:hypothetical protein